MRPFVISADFSISETADQIKVNALREMLILGLRKPQGPAGTEQGKDHHVSQ